MTVVLFTEDTFFPSEDTGKVPDGARNEKVEFLREDMMEDFSTGTSESDSLKYVNSVVMEVDVGDQGPDFVLNLFIHPNLRVVRSAGFSMT